MDYSRVFLCVVLYIWQLCLPTDGACRCRSQVQCDPSYTHCEAGCETGFAGSRCQYANQLAFSSCTMGQRAVDGQLGTCTPPNTKRIICDVEGPTRKFNVIRIFHQRDTGKHVSSFYFDAQGRWEEVSFYRNVTDRITDYKYNGRKKFSRLLLDPKRTVCEVAVTYECLHSSECNLECNCKNASDCLESPRRCPSGCAQGYIGKNYGCTKDTSDPGQMSTSKDTLVSSATYKTPPTPTEGSSGPRQIPTSKDSLVSSATSITPPTPTECDHAYYMDRGNCVKCGTGCELGTCEHGTGNCRCKAGWTGPKCVTHCASDKYGDDCTQDCSSGCWGRRCNSSTGECPDGRCKPGWTNTNPQLQRCDKECASGKYGDDCTQDCSSGCLSKGCNSSTGVCPGGRCKPGWTNTNSQLQLCDKECGDGSYVDGQGCIPCGAGCYGWCEKTNGHCTCKTGWTGTHCNECDHGYYMDRGNCVKCGTGCELGTCEHGTGNCRCKAGWTGPKCVTQCPDGYYGDSCASVCSPGCVSSSCDRETGKCVQSRRRYYCKRGWARGAYNRCDKCASGKYGADCTQDCSSGCLSKGCNSSTGVCPDDLCKPGWMSTNPQLQRCDKECIDGFYGDNCASTCSLGCVSSLCDRKTGTCEQNTQGYYCRRGWAPGSYHRCDKCRHGFYGQVCTPCGAGCHGACDKTNGRCTCKSGWTGILCDKCASGKYGDDCSQDCSSGCERRGCDSSTGECPDGLCKPGWMSTNPQLQLCDKECPYGYYGDNCASTCSPGCVSSLCDRKTGTCEQNTQGYYCRRGWAPGSYHRCDKCRHGFYGQVCTPCGAGCHGACDKTNGRCTCKSGWTGILCDKCASGKYGDDCIQNCSSGCERRGCDSSTGECPDGLCKPGWMSTNPQLQLCDKACVAGTYGQRCTKTCSLGCEPGSCNHVTGDCDCKDGWRGRQCQKPCVAGKYGPRCAKKCNEGCKPELCDRATGACNHRCKDGWTGQQCEEPCVAGTYGPLCTKTCNEGCKPEHCNRATGDCNHKCRDGWKGGRCKNKCRERRYGPGCNKRCRSKCLTCHHVTGSCEGDCRPGWHGQNCTSRCPPGTYGQDCGKQCNEGCQPEKCDSVNGLCGTSCRAGWTGENCVDVCSLRTYGENCLQACSMGCVNQTCDRTTGHCDLCLDGWEHEDQNTTKCDKECDDGRYGESCKEDCNLHCNVTCHHVNGSCIHGCLSGRSGEYCEISEAGHQNINLIVGLLIFIIIMIAVIMCFVFFREPLRGYIRAKENEGQRTNNVPMAERGSQDAAQHEAAKDDDEAIYVNVPNSVPVAVSAFKDFVARKKATKEILVKEYAELPKGLTAIHDKALKQVNSPKNRFRGIYPYDHSLVVLKGNGGSTGYINASYIDGPTRGKQYIATQGPLPNTVEDFWWMIWQEQVPVIVMLANIMEDGKRRCEPYWPNEQGVDTKTFGRWKITVADTCPLADFTIRTLTIKKRGMQRTVIHVHYMVWPDKDVPDNTMSLVELRNKVRTFCDFAQGPMVVHCSAGVGRTGTLIALDSLMEDAETRNMVDIYGCVWRLRNWRVSMVQTQSQYVFLHDCLLDALCHTVHSTPASLYGNAYNQLKNNSNLVVAYQKLCECPEIDHVSDAARDLENIDKNRNKDILPGDKHRAILSTREAVGIDYINAVIAPSYEKRRAFILTQIPLTTTVVDFWRLVHDYDVRGIVLLENYTDMDENCGMFWAKDKKPTKFGPFRVCEGKIEEHTGFTMEKICYKLRNDEREVTVFRSPAWPKESSLPESPSSLLSLIDFLRQWNAGALSPLLVVCRDGATRSGLFCVLASAMQRLLLEKEVALQQTIRSIRFVRKQVIPNLEQFEFCYDSVKAYMDSFQEYSNFA